jgi:NADPH:quinone reductase-like Zn-dependent oxidoreductase
MDELVGSAPRQSPGRNQACLRLTIAAALTACTAGVVMRAGDDCPFKQGDEVFGRQTLDRMRELNGSYSEYAIVDSADVFHKPSNLSHDEAAAVPHACLAAYSALGHVGKLLEKKKQVLFAA